MNDVLYSGAWPGVWKSGIKSWKLEVCVAPRKTSGRFGWRLVDGGWRSNIAKQSCEEVRKARGWDSEGM